ncbi:Acyltransferase [Aphelenchoides bicaudatus]|nr:Acyltransferase [Aphelenchoides bicaudatus]
MPLFVLATVYENRAWIPATLLASQMVPFATISLVNGALSWVVSHKTYCYLDNLIFKTFMESCSFVFENANAAKINLYGNVEALRSKNETSIMLSNHQSDADWAVINALTARHSPNGQQAGLRFVLKKAIHLVPLYGWYTLQRGFIYVDRFGGHNPKPVIRQLHYLATCTPFWLTIFPEGTRFHAKKTELIEQAKVYCRKRGLEKLRHLFVPKSGAFQLSLAELNGSLDSVYDITIGYAQTRLPNRKHDAPNMFEFVTGKSDCYNEVHVHIQRFAISEIPTDASELKLWLHNRFVAKDELIETFYETGSFPSPVETPTSLGSTLRNLSSFVLLNSLVFAAFFVPSVRRIYGCRPSLRYQSVHQILVLCAEIDITASHHFGVLACRACSSFWRRSLVERKVYKCRANNDCDIQKVGMKNACRSCRLKKCREAGMKGEIPSAAIQESLGNQFSTYTEKPDAVYPLEYKARMTNELGRYQINYRNFGSAQRSLFIVENPRAIFSTPEFKILKRLEHERMERGSIALLHTLVSECSETYRNLPKQLKGTLLTVIRNFSFIFCYLNRCYMSAQYYPEMNDPRMCVHFGYYTSKDLLYEFFGDANSDTMEEHIKFCMPIMEKTAISINRFREIQLRENELVALMAIAFHNIMFDLEITNPQLTHIMDAINNELLFDVINNCGITNAGVRIGQLHALLHHVNTRATEMKESMVVAKIFLIDMPPDVWEDLELPDDQP